MYPRRNTRRVTTVTYQTPEFSNGFLHRHRPQGCAAGSQLAGPRVVPRFMARVGAGWLRGAAGSCVRLGWWCVPQRCGSGWRLRRGRRPSPAGGPGPRRGGGGGQLGLRRAEQARPAAGPWTMASGDGAVERDHRVAGHAFQQSVEGKDLRPVGLGRRSRPRRGWRRWRPAAGTRRRPAGAGPRRCSAMPSAMRSWSHRVRSCSASGTSSPSGPVRAGRRASVSSMSASRPATSGSSGSAACSMRVSRIASVDRSARATCGAGAGGVPLVEDEVEHVQDAAQPLGPLGRGGHPERYRRRL